VNELPAENFLAETNEWLSTRIGLSFPKERWPELQKRIHLAAQELGLGSGEALLQWLRSVVPNRHQIEVLASHLTVGETYFFREQALFEVLESQVLSPLIAARRGQERRLRIWSAGCASGEEPYSIAIVLHKLLADLKEWKVTILATDINPSFLAKAAAGAYGKWSFRGTPASILDRYFRKARDGRLETLPEIRKMVQLAYLNLAEDTYPSLATNTNAMDVILCRNVLMYFAPGRAKQILAKLQRSLVDGGWLILGPSELSLVPPDGLARVDFSDAILYRKGDGHSTRPEVRQTGAEAPLSLLPPWEPVYAQRASVSEADPPALSAGLVSTPSGPVGEGSPLSTLDEARELYQAGRYPEAAEKLREQDSPEAMALLVRCLANEGRLTEALLSCERALAAVPGDAGLRYLRATILQEEGRIEEAARSLRQALYLDPTFVLAHFAQGNLALQRGRRRDALKHFRNALSGLADYPQGEILPESEGISAGRLAELIQSTPLGRELA
jgi:chemotaxis protein methyltransferase CheR